MSVAFGPIGQIAYVVDDMDKHVDHWVETLGVGPFFEFPMPLPFATLQLDGVQVDTKTPIAGRIAIAFSGSLVIELIQPGSARSTYSEFLSAGRSGVHHLGTYSERYDEQLAAARSRGIEVLLEAELEFCRFTYLATDGVNSGTVIELIEAREELMTILGELKGQASDWDGRVRVQKLG